MPCVSERVEPLGLNVQWDPNDPAAMFFCDDFGRTVLAMNGHPKDTDHRCVVLVWTGTRSACLSDPNDEAIAGHRLYDKGLSGVDWAGVVRDSRTIDALKQQNQAHPHHDRDSFGGLQHHIVLTKECVAEVVAEAIEVRRVSGTTLEAAADVMRSRP